MELIIQNKSAGDLGAAFGISHERQQELGKGMDEIANSYHGQQLVSESEFLSRIAQICNTTEELVWCTISHTYWLFYVKGIVTCPVKPKISKN